MAQRLVADSSVALKWWLDDEQFAEIENIPLITGDEKFFNTVKGNKSFVRYLSNLERIF